MTLLTDGSGNTVQSFSYDAWGTPNGKNAVGTPLDPSAFLVNFLFTAREFDLETGLYHYRARAYSPAIGRFIQNDPIDFSGEDFNMFRYVANDAINMLDPTGLLRSGGGNKYTDTDNVGEYGDIIFGETPLDKEKADQAERDVIEGAERLPIEIAVELIPIPDIPTKDKGGPLGELFDGLKDLITDIIDALIDPFLKPPDDPKTNSGGE